jgi:hypothetical protein
MRRPSGPAIAVVVLLVVVLLSVAYVLSIGPIWWLVAYEYATPEVLVFYGLLDDAMMKWPALQPWYGSYLQKWLPVGMEPIERVPDAPLGEHGGVI